MNDTNDFLPLGKLEPDFLSELIKKYTTGDASIIVPPQIGGDATVIELGERYLIAKTDPITFVTDDIGYYAININANDIVCMGGIPKYFLGTLLLPENATTRELVEKIFSQVSNACKQLDISFCGGHTEITYGIDRPIIIGQMLGVADKDSIIINSNAYPGCDIILTKGIAIEAVSIIARANEKKLVENYSSEFVEKCQNFIFEPGISVQKDATVAIAAGGVLGLHDPTEGGLAMGLHELAKAAGCGMKIFEKEIPILPEAKFLCDMCEMDILGVIASGALLIISERKSTAHIIDNLKENNIQARAIGKLMDPEYGVKLITDENENTLPEFHQDEITRLFK